MSAASPAPGALCGFCNQRSQTIFARGNNWACFACYMAHPQSIYTLAARMKRAVALAEVLVRLGGDPEAARMMTDADWELAAQAAKIGKPPSLETRQMVVQQLEDYRRNSNV